MSTPRFFMEPLAAGRQTLSDIEGRHAAKARRLSVDDCVNLFDGRGGQAQGRIADIASRQVTIEVGPVSHQHRPHPILTLAVALPKGPRQDVLIEKCTELGVGIIQPIVTERSVSQASDHKIEKWRRATIEAAKQSQQCWLPELRPCSSLEQVLLSIGQYDLALAGIPGTTDDDRLPAMLPRLRKATTVLAIVGPEGGLSDDEIQCILSAGVQPVTLGPNILRVETAAIAIAAWTHALAMI